MTEGGTKGGETGRGRGSGEGRGEKRVSVRSRETAHARAGAIANARARARERKSESERGQLACHVISVLICPGTSLSICWSINPCLWRRDHTREYHRATQTPVHIFFVRQVEPGGPKHNFFDTSSFFPMCLFTSFPSFWILNP